MAPRFGVRFQSSNIFVELLQKYVLIYTALREATLVVMTIQRCRMLPVHIDTCRIMFNASWYTLVQRSRQK